MILISHITILITSNDIKKKKEKWKAKYEKQVLYQSIKNRLIFNNKNNKI